MQRKAKNFSNTKFKQLLIAKPDILHGYLRHADVNQYLEYLERRYANFVKVHTIGHTYEHRPLKAIEIDWCCPKNMLALAKQQRKLRQQRVATGKTRRPKSAPVDETSTSCDNHFQDLIQVPTDRRNIVFIEGGTHAREWITISVALNCIYQLTEKNLRHRKLLEKLRFFIVPVVNPDGYEYTQLKNRRWRKNRCPIKNTKYVGTDCNRNYDFYWENGPSKAYRGTYKGDYPFSELETSALRNVLQKLGPHLLFFLSLHSYSQSIMYPWGYSMDLPDTWPQLQTLAASGRNAIREHTGRKYRCGSISNLTKHVISGSSVDYAFGIVKVPLALVMELPSSEYGFQPPPDMISPIGDESWIGIREMCHCAAELAPVVAPSFNEGSEVVLQVNKDTSGTSLNES